MNRTRSAGFVITLEFLLIMALFVVPVMLGLIMVGRKLYTLYLNQREFNDMPYSRAVVWDTTNLGPAPPPKVVGPVVGYDQFEAPLVIFRDDTTKGGVVLGVRRDRFTSYGQVFYNGANCAGTAYVRAWNAAVGTGAVAPLYLYPPVGFAYQLQGVSYAMGKDNILYSSPDTPPLVPLLALSVWKSQDISPLGGGPPGPPCFPVAVTVDDLVTATEVIRFGSLVPSTVAGYYTPPFRLAFPTPGGGPAPLPAACMTAECP